MISRQLFQQVRRQTQSLVKGFGGAAVEKPYDWRDDVKYNPDLTISPQLVGSGDRSKW